VAFKEQRGKYGRRILLGNDKDGWAVMLWSVMFQCVEVWISTGLPCVCIYRVYENDRSSFEVDYSHKYGEQN
jgi:hypothetical protein